MKIFLDTNVLVAASVRQHPYFARADMLLRRSADGVGAAVKDTPLQRDRYSCAAP